MGTHHARQIAVVRHAEGLHARPAEMIARRAMGFSSRIALVRENHRVDARSILNILTLGAECGVELAVEAEGDDATDAAETIARLVESEFTTAPAPAGNPTPGP